MISFEKLCLCWEEERCKQTFDHFNVFSLVITSLHVRVLLEKFKAKTAVNIYVWKMNRDSVRQNNYIKTEQAQLLCKRDESECVRTSVQSIFTELLLYFTAFQDGLAGSILPLSVMFDVDLRSLF